MINLQFKEKIDDYTIIKHGEIIVNQDKCISIEISDEGDPITLKIEFINQGGRASSISQEISGNIQTLKLINFEQNNSISGVFEPIEVGKIDDNGKEYALYFNCVVHTISHKDGNRFLKYSFLYKE